MIFDIQKMRENRDLAARIAAVPAMEAEIERLSAALEAADALEYVAEHVCAKCEHPTASVTQLDEWALRKGLTAYRAARKGGEA